MAGIFSTLLFSGLLAAAPDGFTFDGPEVTARTTSPTGFFIQGPVPFVNQTERGTGSAELTVQDRLTAPRATFGDVGRLSARFRIGGTDYAVELTSAGFPPAQALPGVSGELPQGLQFPVGGGVILDVDLHGDSGMGFTSAPRMHAGAALWGVGRVLRNGQLLTDTAIIHAAALTAGARSDDDVHGLLQAGRPGDHELYVLVWNLPATEPRGFIEFSFDNVAIDWNGVRLPAIATLPNTLGPGDNGATLASAPVPGGATLGVSVVPSNQGVGGSGSPAGTDRGTTGATGDGDAVTEPVDPFLNEGRVAVRVGQPATAPVANGGIGTPGQANVTETLVDPFLNEGRVGVSVTESGTGPSGPPASGFIQTPTGLAAGQQPDPFLNEGRVARSANVGPAQVNGVAPFGPPLATTGSFSVLPLGTAVSAPSFNFGAAGSDLDVNRTPPLPGLTPGETPAVPLVATPQPLNAQRPVPLVADPTPLNAQTPVPLVSTPQPLNAQQLSPTPGAVGPGVQGTAPITTVTPGAPAVPAAPATGFAPSPGPVPAAPTTGVAPSPAPAP